MVYDQEPTENETSPAPVVYQNHWHYANSIDAGSGFLATIADGFNRTIRHAKIGRITMKPKA